MLRIVNVAWLLLCAWPCAHLDAEPEPLKIATYNIKGGHHTRTAADNIEEFFATTRPDIICLQEIRYRRDAERNGTGHAADLAKRLGPEYTWAAAPRPIILHHPTQHGPAIVARGKLVHTEPLMLKPDRAYGVLTEFDIDGQTIIIVSAHFYSLPGASVTGALTTEDERVHEVAHLVNRLKDETKPIVIGCDGNAMSFFPSANTMAHHFTDVAAKAQNPEPTFTVRDIGIRIDYLYTSNHFKVNSSIVPNLHHSDHKPVIANVELKIFDVKPK